MLGRLLTNIGVGYALIIALVYIVEISPTLYRSLLTSFPELFINVGTLLGYISHYFFFRLRSNIGWHVLLCVGGITLGLLAVGVFTMLESPCWLIMQGRLGVMKRILTRISNSKEEATLQLAEIKEAAGIPKESNDDVVKVTGQSTGEGMWRELLH